MKDIPGYDSFVKIEPIDYGISSDQKSYIETADGKRFILRVSDISEHDRKKAAFERMKRMDEAGVPMPRPVDFGVCNSGKSVYQLLTWCDGENLEKVLPSLSETEQYAIGIKVGEIARKIHSVNVDKRDIIRDSWNEQYSNFIDESIKDYYASGAHIDGEEAIFNYFNNNRYLLKNRPQCYIHGDYHPGNLMLSNKQEITVIDWEIHLFNCYGDPWAEICMRNTSHFSTGMLRGYFKGEPPEEYWRILALYISIGGISAITWAYYHHPELLESRKKYTSDVLEWYDNMQTIIPSWYLQGCELWDIYDANRNLTGQTILRCNAKNLKDGEFHLAAFIYIMCSEGKFLITKRSPRKKTFPNMWEIPHGAVLSGETSLDAAIREAFEECGLVLQRETAEYITEYRGSNFISDKWLFRQEFNLADIVLQEGETCDARACTTGDILELIKNNEMQEYIYHDIKLIKEKWSGAQ